MIRHITTQDGLPGNYLKHVFQSKSGYIWISSNNGLTRYDGQDIYTYTTSNTLGWEGSNKVQTICEDQNGAIWFNGRKGSDNQLYVLRRPNEDTTVVKVSDDNFLFHSCMGENQVAIFKKNRLVVASNMKSKREFALPMTLRDLHDLRIFSEGGEELWLSSKEEVYKYVDGEVQQVYSLDQNVLNLTKNEDGDVLFTTRSGNYILRDSTVKSSLEFRKSFSGRMMYNSSSLWFNESDSVYVVNPTSVLGIPYKHSGVEFKAVDKIFTVDEETYVVWNIASLEGRLMHWRKDRSWESIGLERYGVKAINWMSKDHEGGVWITTDVGLFHVVPRKMSIYSIHEGLADLQTFAVAKDARGRPWVSVWGDGVQRLEDKQWDQLSEESGLLFNFVMSFFPENDGTMWVGTNRGVMRYHDDRILEAYPYTFEPNIAVYTPGLLRDSKGRLWVANARNLFQLQNGNYIPAWPEEIRAVKTIVEDSRGHILAGTRRGIYDLDLQGRWSRWLDSRLQAFSIQDISEDSRGALWISTSGGGLIRKEGEDLFVFSSSNGLPSDQLHFSIDDGMGYLWVGTDNGLFRIPFAGLDGVRYGRSKEILNIDVFTEEDGMPSAELISGSSSALRAEDGKLWIATLGGVAVIDPAHIPTNTQKPNMLFHGFSVQGRKEAIRSGQRFRTGPKNTVTFNFATLSFHGSRRKAYQYKLDGYDTEWSTTTLNEKPYSGLRPGDYTFWVKGSNNDGVWSDATSISFTILPVFYQALWFWAIVICIALSFLFLLYRQIQFKNVLDLAMTRHRIADDLHDDIGSKIGAVAQTLSFMSDKEALNDKDIIVLRRQVEVTRELVDDLRDSVWIVDADKDTLAQLLSRMEFFTQQMGIGHNCQFVKPDDIPSRQVTMDWRRNVYLLFKEGIHNIIRHARASALFVNVSINDNLFTLELYDNGCGIDEAIDSHGRGLSTMQRRASEIGGKLRISGEDGVGTLIRFECIMP